MQLKRAFCKLKKNKQIEINNHTEFLILFHFMVIWKSGYQTISFFSKSKTENKKLWDGILVKRETIF